MTDQTIENIKSQRDRALHEADQERQRAENAESILRLATAEVASLQAQLTQNRLNALPVTESQRQAGYHELFPFGNATNGV